MPKQPDVKLVPELPMVVMVKLVMLRASTTVSHLTPYQYVANLGECKLLESN